MATRQGTPYQTDNRRMPAALDSADGQTSGLRGTVSSNDYKHFSRLARILGLSDKNAVKEWLGSKAFKPAFDELVDEWIYPQQTKAEAEKRVCKRGPDLKAVIEAIEDESIGGENNTINGPLTGQTSKRSITMLVVYSIALTALLAANIIQRL